MTIQEHSSQNCVLLMIEKCGACMDNGLVGGAIPTNLPKVFDCINHDLLIPIKLAAYGFSYFLKFI